MNGISISYSSSQLFDACRLLFPGAQVQEGFLHQLHQHNVKTAYRGLAKEYHPDSRIGKADTARHTDIFRRVTSAYELLSGFIRERDSLAVQPTLRPQPRSHSQYQRSYTQPGNRAYRPRPHVAKNVRLANEQYYNGQLPTIPLKFGLYLYYRSVVSYQAVVRAIIWQRDMRPPFGELACAWGWLDPFFISVIRSATDIPGSFGERAIHLGLMSESQVKVILMHQKTMQLPVGRYFVDKGLMSEFELRKYLREHSQHNRVVARGES